MFSAGKNNFTVHPPCSIDHNSTNIDIMQGCLALEFLNKVLTLCVFVSQKLSTVTNYLTEVTDGRWINMYM